MDISLLDEPTRAFYERTMRTLNEAEVPYLVGGAYAFGRYTGIERHTKDLDLFIIESQLDSVVKVLEDAGFVTELSHPHWLAKVLESDAMVDLIFASGNGISYVDESWFSRSVEDELLGIPVRLCAPEEIIWMKAFIMERERFDGPDVMHLIRDCAHSIDWKHLLRLFGPHWRILYAHLILFDYIYPFLKDNIPDWVLTILERRLRRERESAAADEQLCRGPLLSRAQYLDDTEKKGYIDARLRPHGRMSMDEIADWTAKIDEEEAAIFNGRKAS